MLDCSSKSIIMMYTFAHQNRAYNNLNKKMIIQVNTNYKLYYVNQESKDTKKTYSFKQNITW